MIKVITINICGLEFECECDFHTGTPTTALSEYPDDDELEITGVECLNFDSLDVDLFFERFEDEFYDKCWNAV